MAEPWGGKRTPASPKPVSGPGRLSQRTDGGPQQVQAQMSGMPYGENAEFNTMQSEAPMSATPAMRPSRGGRAASGGARSGSPMSPLFAPTQRPDEPLTAGAPFGPGDGPPMSFPQSQRSQVSSTLSKASQYSKDSTLARMAEIFARRGM
jgi:hypothetical protein